MKPVPPITSAAPPVRSGLVTFARLPALGQTARVHAVIAGVPFDAAANVRPGARFGPAHVRRASRLLQPYHQVAGLAPYGQRQVADAGDITCSPFDLRTAGAQIMSAARTLTEGGRRLLAIGGDHTITLPLLHVAGERYGPVALLHFGVREPRPAAGLRQAAEAGLIDLRHSLHVAGIAAVGPFDPVYAVSPVEAVGLIDAIGRMREHLGHGPVYVSIDLSPAGPDPADLSPADPGTAGYGGPGCRPGGGLLAMLRALDRVVGADVVGVTPAYDPGEQTGTAAAAVAYELLSILAKDG